MYIRFNNADVSATNPVPIEIVGSLTNDITFHDAATIAADGAVFTVGGYKTLTVELYGTSTSKTVAFMGVGPSGVAHAIMGVKLLDLSTAVSSVGSLATSEFWQFDITGLTSVIMDLTVIANGNVTVKGRAVA